MKKFYLLISIVFISLTSSCINNNHHHSHDDTSISSKIDIDSSKYLSLAYENGKFFSWNHSQETSEHIIGIFTSNDHQSYLLSNTGIFTNLQYEVNNLTRISDHKAIVQLQSYYDRDDLLLIKKNFLVEINSNNNFIILSEQPINSVNNNFVQLDDNNFVAFGIGLDLVTISDNDVTITNIIAPYEGGYNETYFYPLSANSGILVNGDQQYYYLTDITGNVNKQSLGFSALANFNNNVKVINSNEIIFLDHNNEIWHYNLSQNLATDLTVKSYAKNFGFILNETSFVINVSQDNISNIFGKPYLVDTSDLKLKAIENQTSLLKIVTTDDNNGIFIDGNFIAYNFNFINSNFSFNLLGNISDYQYINQNLGFASLNNNNFLLSSVANNIWDWQKTITFSAVNSTTRVSFLNNIILDKKKIIDNTNAYFTDGALMLNVYNPNLVKAVIYYHGGSMELLPGQNRIKYTFTSFNKYKINVIFKLNDVTYTVPYQINFNDFDQGNLLKILGTNIINYVGITNNQLLDIQAVNENTQFTISDFNYDLLQTVQLIRYTNDNLVIGSVSSLQENDIVKPLKIDMFSNNEDFYGLKIKNLLNQVSMLYLGFIHNDGTKPIVEFWDTQQGKELRSVALSRNYTSQQLDDMNATAINNLINLAKTWRLFKGQATVLGYVIIAIINISIILALYSLIYNWYLDKKIENKEQVKDAA